MMHRQYNLYHTQLDYIEPAMRAPDANVLDR